MFSGSRVNGSQEIAHNQRIKSVGGRRFHLEYLNLSKESISTEINPEMSFKFKYEKPVRREVSGCCAIFGP